jgi:hypothetical protein
MAAGTAQANTAGPAAASAPTHAHVRQAQRMEQIDAGVGADVGALGGAKAGVVEDDDPRLGGGPLRRRSERWKSLVSLTFPRLSRPSLVGRCEQATEFAGQRSAQQSSPRARRALLRRRRVTCSTSMLSGCERNESRAAVDLVRNAENVGG